jgi:hypothetical protein
MSEHDGKHARGNSNAKQDIELATPCGARKLTVGE